MNEQVRRLSQASAQEKARALSEAAERIESELNELSGAGDDRGGHDPVQPDQG